MKMKFGKNNWKVKVNVSWLISFLKKLFRKTKMSKCDRCEKELHPDDAIKVVKRIPGTEREYKEEVLCRSCFNWRRD